MATVTIEADLADAASAKDFYREAYALTEAWEAAGVGAVAIEPTLQFMERNPDLDFGSPGPLTHFIERVRGSDYGELLMKSVARAPTAITILMLNRLINGKSSEGERRPLISCMRLSRSKIENDATLSDMVADFLAHIATKHPGE